MLFVKVLLGFFVFLHQKMKLEIFLFKLCALKISHSVRPFISPNRIFAINMSQISIREVRKSDNIALASIIRATFHEFNAPKEGTVYSDPTTDDLFELFGADNAHLFVVEENNEILGCCGIYPTKGLPIGCTEIVKFYLANKGRGQGYGKALYLACEQKAIALNYTQLYIESIPEFNTAIGLYEKLGFKPLQAPLGNTGHFGCDIWLLKDLKI